MNIAKLLKTYMLNQLKNPDGVQFKDEPVKTNDGNPMSNIRERSSKNSECIRTGEKYDDIPIVLHYDYYKIKNEDEPDKNDNYDTVRKFTISIINEKMKGYSQEELHKLWNDSSTWVGYITKIYEKIEDQNLAKQQRKYHDKISVKKLNNNTPEIISVKKLNNNTPEIISVKKLNNNTPEIIVELIKEKVPDHIVKLTEEMLLTHGEKYLMKEWRKSSKSWLGYFSLIYDKSPISTEIATHKAHNTNHSGITPIKDAGDW
jgi:hypothetical protein